MVVAYTCVCATDGAARAEAGRAGPGHRAVVDSYHYKIDRGTEAELELSEKNGPGEWDFSSWLDVTVIRGVTPPLIRGVLSFAERVVDSIL